VKTTPLEQISVAYTEGGEAVCLAGKLLARVCRSAAAGLLSAATAAYLLLQLLQIPSPLTAGWPRG
jgi:hypothetical protein